LRRGKRERKRSAAATIRIRPDLATVIANDRSGYEKAQSETFNLGSDKRFEQAGSDRRVDTASGIAYTDANPSRFLGDDLDGYDASIGIGFGDRVEGIKEQIHQALLQLSAVAEYTLHGRTNLGAQRNAAHRSFTAEQLYNSPDQDTDADRGLAFRVRL